MKRRAAFFWKSELETQIEFCLKAYCDLDNSIGLSHSKERTIAIWYAIQMILISTANMSKLFQKYTLKSPELADDIQLISDRTFRNHFEHYWERLENWITEHDGEAFIDMCMTSGQSEIKNSTVSLRTLDVGKLVLTFCGNSIDLLEIKKSTLRIKEALIDN